MTKNIIAQKYHISKEDRQNKNKHKSLLVWFTGLSGSGKSTIANALEIALFNKGISSYVLDGDNIRFGLNKDLDFSELGREENIRRIAEVAHLMIDAGLVVLAAFVSPYKKDRENIRKIVKDFNFVEIYVNTPLEECERRDVKGFTSLLGKERLKTLQVLTHPMRPQTIQILEIKTDQMTVSEAVELILERLLQKIELK